jgi:hypothetical protein
MKNICRLAVVLTLCSFAFAAFAQNAAGKWKGKIDTSAMKATNENERKGLAMMKKMFEKAYINLELKSNKTYSVEMGGMGTPKPTSETGKWSQTGRTVSVTSTKKTEKMTISADGKTMIMLPPAADASNMPKGMKIVFKRA